MDSDGIFSRKSSRKQALLKCFRNLLWLQLSAFICNCVCVCLYLVQGSHSNTCQGAQLRQGTKYLLFKVKTVRLKGIIKGLISHWTLWIQLEESLPLPSFMLSHLFFKCGRKGRKCLWYFKMKDPTKVTVSHCKIPMTARNGISLSCQVCH